MEGFYVIFDRAQRGWALPLALVQVGGFKGVQINISNSNFEIVSYRKGYH